MKAKRIIVILAVLVLGFSTFSYAEGIDYRVRQAQEQIERGIKSGALTREEANRLKDELNNVLKELDRLERHISNLKSNDNRRDHDGRSENHQQRWIICAAEGEYCKFKGQKSIRYGAGDKWNYQTARNGISCSYKVFGDPAPGVHKACYVEAD
jgi:cell division protein FtsB